MNVKETDPQLSEISSKLDVLIRLKALSLMKDAKTRRDRIAILSDASIAPKSIAGILGTTENNVNVTLHAIRKERAARQAKEGDSSQASESMPKGGETVPRETNTTSR